MKLDLPADDGVTSEGSWPWCGTSTAERSQGIALRAPDDVKLP